MPIIVIQELTPSQVQDLEQLYKQGWWSHQRTSKDIQKMLNHSDIIIGLVDSDTQKLIGFTRVLTDYTYRALIWDVLVESSYQNQGLGKKLIDEILTHPALKDVEAFLLMCLPEMVPFYEKLGFHLSDSVKLMSLENTTHYGEF
ncbi:putative N-acetyltransferase ycf52 [Planktothrix tepida]|uniref:GCN5-related N-acetyltransferase n=2 Tax=Planktothrix TaxID=54304 RepID=A0A1J1LPJ5_9CYAN|nr:MULTISPECIES: GNAT family N-acetyltransferase [Planktothrix]CAD5954900.1 putative N-acetyltransferase ycf52 [Planktothrix pseudagardhii]CAD5955599.1 putative N-acetyltransferase ycf52 [Planktothrix tepida]CUR34158.1 GCN5-related N-acetyltransferase [Planktothrix tepida PCC 9214]